MGVIRGCHSTDYEWRIVVLTLVANRATFTAATCAYRIYSVCCIFGLPIYMQIISTARAAQLTDVSVGLCAAFCFLDTAAYAADAYFCVVAWRRGDARCLATRKRYGI